MMELSERRKAIRHLLNESDPVDATAAYYALHSPEDKVQLFCYPAEATRAEGYVCLARSGLDLFRPLVTWRLPKDEATLRVEPAAAASLIYSAMPKSASVITLGPTDYQPIVSALFDIQKEETLTTRVLDRGRFQPIINVLVTRSNTPDGQVRYVIKQQGGTGESVASAGVNWQTTRFADIYVRTVVNARRQGLGRSVVASLVHHLLAKGLTPLYTTADHNTASIRLAEATGFVDIGIRKSLMEATLRSPQ